MCDEIGYMLNDMVDKGRSEVVVLPMNMLNEIEYVVCYEPEGSSPLCTSQENILTTPSTSCPLHQSNMNSDGRMGERMSYIKSYLFLRFKSFPRRCITSLMCKTYESPIRMKFYLISYLYTTEVNVCIHRADTIQAVCTGVVGYTKEIGQQGVPTFLCSIPYDMHNITPRSQVREEHNTPQFHLSR